MARRKLSPDQKKRVALRRKAEAKLKVQMPSPEDLNPADALRLVHELRIHQIELEMQNEELRQAQALLEESRHKYSDLYDFAPVGYLTLDRRGLIVEANLTAATLLGVERARLLGRVFPTFFHPSDRKVLRDHLAEVFLSQSRRRQEAGLVLSGKPLTMLLDSIYVQDADGRPLCRTILTDITELKKAQEELKKYRDHLEDLVKSRTAELEAANRELRVQAEELEAQKEELGTLAQHLEQERNLLDEVLRQMPAGVIVAEAPSGRVILGNRQVGHTLRKPYHPCMEISEYIYYQAFHSDGRPYEAEEWPLARSLRGEEVEGEEIAILRGDGTRGVININAAPVKDREGKIFAAVAAFIDVTDSKEAEEAFRRSEERERARAIELEAANQEMEEFSYSVSKDLRTPLRAIEGFSRMLAEEHGDNLSPEARRRLNVIRENASLMETMIDGLQALSRLGRAELGLQPIDMNFITERLWKKLQAKVPERQLACTIKPLPAAVGNLEMIERVWQIYLDNAIRFTAPKEGKIEVGGWTKDGENIYYVEDNGVGFDMKFADRLFHIFQTLHSRRKLGGIGLGLATAQRIIKLHHGRVWAEGKVNEGATFYFSLPKT